MTDVPARISASQVSLILQRAAEIDARGDTLTVEELKRIAAEAGIDPAATEVAIREVTAGEEAAPAPTVRAENEKANLPATKSRLPSPRWIVAGGAVGTALGFMTALPDVLGITAFGATVIYLVIRALQSMKPGAQLDFQLQNFAVWFGMFVGGTAIGTWGDAEVFAMAFLFGIVSSVVGGLIVRFGPREEKPEDEAPQLGPGRS
ncbi:MAG: hypothetical protein OXN92_13725 [Gammaproteobacteria bacterium]|nr:hypothetical protein [Gammaproteobacteria bacterium]